MKNTWKLPKETLYMQKCGVTGNASANDSDNCVWLFTKKSKTCFRIKDRCKESWCRGCNGEAVRVRIVREGKR
jgi:hypothetical protein